MTDNFDIIIKKPVALWNRELSISPKDFFYSLSKAAISGVAMDGKGVAENLLDAIKDIAPQDSPANAAWLLVYKSIQKTLSELIKEYVEFFSAQINDQMVKILAAELEEALNGIEVGFDASFFDHPHKLALLEDLKDPLKQWLTALGMSDAQANAFHLRFKERFVLTLHQQWLATPNEYVCIKEALDSPFVKATMAQRGWMQYSAWLQEQSNERMFDEAFSLSQVFVPLRAYYKEKTGKPDRDLNGGGVHGPSMEKCIVVDLHTEVETWLRNFDAKHAVRIISGGPGSGKSSFGKIFAAFAAREIKEVQVIFVPLHHFDPTDNLITAMELFVKGERFLTGSPLDASECNERLLIIFDGLDELSMQGKAAAETAQLFVDEVINKIDKLNGQGAQHQALITGRDMAVQSALSRLREERQILHVLPYYISRDEAEDYVDEKNLLEEDQRSQWWEKYGIAKGVSYEGLPKELSIDRLTPITREPLLNYLVALSFERKKIEFTSQTTLNTIYEDLLYAVHERQWDHGCHEGAKHLNIREFVRVLEEIALAVWHGDGRTATVNQIYKQCVNSNLSRYLEVFQEGAEKGVSRLLTAFYFRQSEQLQAGDKTFEFTHKSFGEYLIARRIVRSIKQLHNELLRHDEDPDSGFDEREALKRWVELCGPTTTDWYVFEFLCDELAACPDKLEEWQQIFVRLISFAVRNGTPMELIDVTRFKETMRQSRNAEEALMAVHYACADNTKKVSTINWGETDSAFGEWIKRLQGQRSGPGNKLILNCLALLDLSNCRLDMFDFYGAKLVGSNLGEGHFYSASFGSANLSEVNLEKAHLQNANIEHANLTKASLFGAYLRDADLSNSCVKNANLQKANCGNVNFEGASLQGANLRGANLKGANFKGANLEGANLKEAQLEGANFERAYIRKTKFDGAKPEGGILDKVKFSEFRRVRLNQED